MIENIENHIAYTCKCGGVNFAMLKSGGIECNKCSTTLDGVKWWSGGIGAQIARAIKAEDALLALQVTQQAEQVPPEKSLSCVLTDWEKWALSTGLDERNHDLVDALTEIRKAFDTETSALLQVLYAVREYLPPDGISEKDIISKVISIVDPWPTSLPAAPKGAV